MKQPFIHSSSGAALPPAHQTGSRLITRLETARSVFTARSIGALVETEYDLDACASSLLYYVGSHLHYLVVTSAGERYLLRLLESRLPWSAEGAAPAAGVAYELDLLLFLEGRGARVPRPIRRRDGSLFGTIEAAEGPRCFTLFGFVEGERPAPFDRERAFRYGESLATLHGYMAGFTPPAARYQIGPVYLFQQTLRLFRAHGEGMRPGSLAFLSGVAERARRGMEQVPRTRPLYGTIHGDVHPGNALEGPDGRFGFVDFETAGEGWRAYDIATFTGMMRMGWGPPLESGTEPGDAAEGFLAGYASKSPLDAAETGALPHFEVARLFEFLGFWMWELSTGKVGVRNCERHVDEVLATLRRWDAEGRTDAAAAFRPTSLDV